MVLSLTGRRFFYIYTFRTLTCKSSTWIFWKISGCKLYNKLQFNAMRITDDLFLPNGKLKSTKDLGDFKFRWPRNSLLTKHVLSSRVRRPNVTKLNVYFVSTVFLHQHALIAQVMVNKWGCSSDGRAFASHVKSPGFNSWQLHKTFLLFVFLFRLRKSRSVRNMRINLPWAKKLSQNLQNQNSGATSQNLFYFLSFTHFESYLYQCL